MANIENKERRKLVEKYRAKGWTFQRIADKLGISVQLARYYLTYKPNE